MDLKIRFGIKFCLRYTLPEVCTIKNYAKTIYTANKAFRKECESERDFQAGCEPAPFPRPPLGSR